MVDPSSPLGQRVLSSLRKTVPFLYLGDARLARLLAEGECQGFSAGQTVITQGDTGNAGVYFLLSGSVESIDTSVQPSFRVNLVEAGNYFGEHRAVFGTIRHLEVRALEDSVCFLMPGDHFRLLLSESRPFAQAVGQVLRSGQGIFGAFERFSSELSRDVALGHIELRALLPLYQALEPAIHPLANDGTNIDWSALLYATRRLPDNVTRSFVFLLTDDLPLMYDQPDQLFEAVASESRHRFVYEMLPGKDMVLVRTGISDLVDFVTCLCLFAVETHKIRYRLNHPDLVRAVRNFAMAKEADRPADDDILASLPFSPEDRAALKRIWPRATVERLHEITFNRQAYSLDIRKQVQKINARLSELWTSQVNQAVESLLGMRAAELPPELEVHIVSSNTHSLSNCLNPFFLRRSADILRWAESRGLRPEGGAQWSLERDEVYALARPYLKDNPAALGELRDLEAQQGILRLAERVSTGIQVQLVDSQRLDYRLIDPELAQGLKPPAGARRKLIVNIDYAFGEQAEDIMRYLILLFGRNIASINVMGKAGALVGKRGDVLYPSAFIEQRSDAFATLDSGDPNLVASLQSRLGSRSVHLGPLLTVGGTLLQNSLMLNFYKSIWACVGIEMEGIFYHWAISEARQLGLLSPQIRPRFLYYVSDLPLQRGASLSERLSPHEGVPPLYAITREFLTRILAG